MGRLWPELVLQDEAASHPHGSRLQRIGNRGGRRLTRACVSWLWGLVSLTVSAPHRLLYAVLLRCGTLLWETAIHLVDAMSPRLDAGAPTLLSPCFTGSTLREAFAENVHFYRPGRGGGGRGEGDGEWKATLLKVTTLQSTATKTPNWATLQVSATSTGLVLGQGTLHALANGVPGAGGAGQGKVKHSNVHSPENRIKRRQQAEQSQATRHGHKHCIPVVVLVLG